MKITSEIENALDRLTQWPASWGHLKTSPLTLNDTVVDTVVYVRGIEINDQPL